MQAKNEIGHRYGRLVVVAFAETRRRQAYWACRCDCGKRVTVSGTGLRNGHTRSCGCLQLEGAVARCRSGVCKRTPKDLIGHRYGKLVVVAPGPSGQHVTWRCACDCGNVTVVRAEMLRSGHTRSCGCLMREVAGTRYFKSEVGKRYGRLVVVARAGNTHGGQATWTCACDCGKTTTVAGGNLRNGQTRSCGCLRATFARALPSHTTHGMSNSPEYYSWRAMIQRCENRKHRAFPLYGGAGVTVCDAWHSFAAFYADKGPRPEGTSLGRPLDLGNYGPTNCRWMTRAEQGAERRKKLRLKRRIVARGLWRLRSAA